MPGSPSPFDDMFAGGLGTLAKEVYQRFTGWVCNVEGCENPPIPFRCVACNEMSCTTHGFFNISGVSICSFCGAKLCGRPAIDPSWPWSELGVAPGASVDDIKRAFRAKAKSCHPDSVHAPEKKAEAAEQWAKLRAAYDAAMGGR